MYSKAETSLCRERSVQSSYGFSSSHVQMWELDHREDWVLKNWCLWTVVLEKPLESPLDCKEIKPKGNQILKEINPEYSLEAQMLKLQYFGHLMRRANSWKRPWCWERLRAKEEGVAEDEMLGWRHQFNGQEFEQTPGDSEGQGSLACYSLWGCKESDTT